MTSATTIVLMVYFIQGSMGLVLPQSSIVGIAGGHPVDIEDAPFMASLFNLRTYKTNETFYFWCGGSIVHQQFVLTAAHCVDDTSNLLIVRVGSSNRNTEGYLYGVEKYIKHEKFSYTTFENNVALLKLSEPVTFGTAVTAIKLADENVGVYTGLAANVTGWGYTEDTQEIGELRQVSVTVSPPDDCNEFYRNRPMLSSKDICVYNKGKGACFFDEGGPLTAGDYQIGVSSNGPACFGKPNVYAKVAPYLQWIHNKISENL